MKLKRPRGAHPRIAVMGDLVGSEQARSRTALHNRFNRAIDQANRATGEALLSPMTITLGDEFQGLVTDFKSALRAVRSIRLDLLQDKVDCRFAIGLVRVVSPVNASRAWNMMGPGLAETRERLNEKRLGSNYRFHLPHADQILEHLMEAVGGSLSHVEANWTDRQIEVVNRLLHRGMSIEGAQTSLNIATRTLYKIRQAADFDFYTEQWSALEAAADHLDGSYGL